MDLTKEAIETLQRSGTERVWPLPGEPKHVYLLHRTGPDGKELVERVEAAPAPRGDVFYSLEDFTEDCNARDAAAVYYGRGQMAAVLSDDRRDRLHMPLDFTREFALLGQLAGGDQPKPQAAFVRLLQVNLHGCVEPDVVAAFKDLRFRKLSQGGATAAVAGGGKESLTVESLKEISLGGKDVPETVTVNVSVYENRRSSTQHVLCAVVLDLEALTFALVPMAGEIERATAEADFGIRTDLKSLLSNGIPVYYGYPSQA